LLKVKIGENSILVESGSRFQLDRCRTARLGGDIGFNYAGIHATVCQLLTRTATNGVWFQGDPDCFAMRGENLDLSAEEKRILTGTVGLFGGLFLTSDYPTQWNTDDTAFVRQFWNQQGPRLPRRQYVVRDADGEVVAYRVSYDDGRFPTHRIALYNWSDAARAIRLRLSDARLRSGPVLRLAQNSIAAGAVLTDGVITDPNQPPHSLRIIDLLEDKWASRRPPNALLATGLLLPHEEDPIDPNARHVILVCRGR
jgi:hypothetical protein